MAIDLNHALANIALEVIATAFPAGSILELRSGAAPGAEAAAGGTLLAEVTLPAGPWLAAVNGVLAKDNTWEDPTANAAGTIEHYRLRNAADNRRIEGAVTITGGGGDLTVDNTNVAAGQNVIITAYQYTS